MNDTITVRLVVSGLTIIALVSVWKLTGEPLATISGAAVGALGAVLSSTHGQPKPHPENAQIVNIDETKAVKAKE